MLILSDMKALLLLLPLFALLGCAEDDTEVLKQAARKGEFPVTFSSEESARKYVGHLFAHGRVDHLRIGLSAYLVVYQHGSGIPVVRIGIYRRAGLRWRLISEQHSPTTAEHLGTESEHGKLVTRGERSGRTWVLHDPAEESDSK